MNTSSQRFFGSLVFNYHLLTINGKPLKFSLHGFGPVEFRDIVRIIEAFGGKLSHPDGPQTLVLVDPNHTSEWLSNHYDIQFLEDSIIAQELQNLDDYRLAPAESQKLRRFVDNNVQERGSNKYYSEVSGISLKGENSNPRTTVKGSEEKFRASSSTRASIPQALKYSPARNRYAVENANGFDRNTHTKGSLKIKSDVILATPIINYSAKTKNVQTNENEVKRDGNIPKLCQSNEIPLMKDDKGNGLFQQENDNIECTSVSSRESFSEAEEACIPDSSYEESECSANEEKELSRGEWSDESFTSLQSRVVDSYKRLSPLYKSAHKKSLNQLNKKYSRTHNETEVEAPRRMSKFDLYERETPLKVNKLHLTKPRPTTPSGDDSNPHWKERSTSPEDKNMTSDSENSNSVINDRDSFSSSHNKLSKSQKSMAEKHQVAENTKPRHFYTEEDDRRLVQYLVEKKAISRAGGKTIWKEFLAEQPQDGPKRSALGLNHRFKRHAVHKYKEYTDDPEALQEFEKLLATHKWHPRVRNGERKPRKPRKKTQKHSTKVHYYSDEDNRRLIKFLIEKNAIGRAGGIAIWREFSENETLTHDPQPGENALAMHFKKYLFNTYRQYTDDPLAIAEFEKYYPCQTKFKRPISIKNKSITRGIKRKSKTSVVEPESKRIDKRRENGSGGSDDESSAQSVDSDCEAVARMIEEALKECSSENDDNLFTVNTTQKLDIPELDLELSIQEKESEVLNTNAVPLDEDKCFKAGETEQSNEHFSNEEGTSGVYLSPVEKYNRNNQPSVDSNNPEDVVSSGAFVDCKKLNDGEVEANLAEIHIGNPSLSISEDSEPSEGKLSDKRIKSQQLQELGDHEIQPTTRQFISPTAADDNASDAFNEEFSRHNEGEKELLEDEATGVPETVNDREPKGLSLN